MKSEKQVTVLDNKFEIRMLNLLLLPMETILRIYKDL